MTLLGADIGGTHITCAAVTPNGDGYNLGEPSRRDVDASASAEVIIDAWATALERTAPPADVAALGIAMPGPFDYPRGISLVRGLHKFDTLYAQNVGDLLRTRLELSARTRIVFENDVNAFTLGEWLAGSARGRRRVIGLTLGTGFGSGFLADGRVMPDAPDLPPDTTLGFVPYRDGIAEDYISRRGLRKLYTDQGGDPAKDVADIAAAARHGDRLALAIFADLGRMLADVLGPFARSFRADAAVIGGAIARSYDLFCDTLLPAIPETTEIAIAQLPETAGLLGAAHLAYQHS